MRLNYFCRLYCGLFIAVTCIFISCKKSNTVNTAFYYWKTTFNLNAQQSKILKEQASNNLYLHFFDIKWDDTRLTAYPDAIIKFHQHPDSLNITPVIYITNKTFENINANGIDSLAIHCSAFTGVIAKREKISYKTIQIDCDWTIGTREKYFNFLTKLKLVTHHQIEATIRLHQVKYKERTGVPPVDKGILMFYNMGKLNAGIKQTNSIYNENDAAKYIQFIPQYPLPLDVALGMFSWAVQIREGKIIQVYGNLGSKELNDPLNFEAVNGLYVSKKSFFLNGIYIRENDTFKLEETNNNSLKLAAKQLAPYMPKNKNRTIIYYELANINLEEFNTKTFNKVSAVF
ncbi:MAG TPA: hypothetical protein VL490_05400 [Mucilaginibacter sp.]|jgi:hypothetical protein|nr:hypothetical protein [Mucilaginibacter sp.]